MTAAAWTIRDGLLQDIEDIVSLERAVAEAPHWPPGAYQEILRPDKDHLGGRKLFVGESAEGLLGFSVGSLTGIAPDIHAELESVAVRQAARRLGLGRALCQAVLDWCRDLGAAEIMLEVRSASAAPIALYTSLGFEMAGRRAHYYADPPDAALLMRLPFRLRST